MALKTLSAHKIDSYGKNKTLFEKIGVSLGPSEQFQQIASKMGENR